MSHYLDARLKEKLERHKNYYGEPNDYEKERIYREVEEEIEEEEKRELSKSQHY